MTEPRVGLIGATSMVGDSLLPLLIQAGCRVTAYSRRTQEPSAGGVAWRRLPIPSDTLLSDKQAIPSWICLAPIWVLPDYFELLKGRGVRRLVALSSTSRFTKQDSSDAEEQAVARRLTESEARVRDWAEDKRVEWVILRPTLIYGGGRDRNVCDMASFIRRFGFLPLLGQASGLRQPVHATDVAAACLAALDSPAAANRAYDLSGVETLTYREMTERVFTALGRRPKFVTAPLGIFKFAVICLRWLPHYRHWSVAMAERMNKDMVFDHADAARDLGFRPRRFSLSANDLPGR